MPYSDEFYMQRCLQLAAKGRSTVKPNPMVGSVIVHNNKIIGEGYHKKYGQAHAEVNAINSVKDISLFSESTLYVNLEPCAHHGKTPPCSDLIIKKNIKKVVIGCVDSFAKVAGKGILKMEAAGIEVKVGILKKESLDLNKAFFVFHSKKRPYIILKWAQTLDGYIDIDRNLDHPIGVNWITHPHLRLPVHKWRSEESAILIGEGTLINDNPQLDTREWFGDNPLRILMASDISKHKDYKLFNGSTPTLVYSNASETNSKNTEYIKVSEDENMIDKVLEHLYKSEIQSVIIEGGNKTLQSFIDLNCWDETRVLIGDKTFGSGLKAPKLKQTHINSHRFANDTILLYINN